MTITTTEEQKLVKAALTHKITELGFAVKPLEEVSVGPIISIYRFEPVGKTRVAQLEALAPDFSVMFGTECMVKRMPGEASVSVSVPNKERTFPQWKNIVSEVWRYYQANTESIPLGFGVTYLGTAFVENLPDLPHLLIAGTTGGGKSTLLSSIIASLIYTLSPAKLQLVLSDTKGVEFGHFIGAPHLMFPPATTVFQTLEHMEWLIQETDDRMKQFALEQVRNIHEHNTKYPQQCRSRIVMVFDELATILGGSSKSKSGEARLAEAKLEKIVQLSRASGIYIIAATQRPSGDVVKGVIKANFPARLTFRLPSDTDSKYAINESGAEQLLMRGDMFYSSPNKPGLHRLHAPWASLEDIKGAVEAAIMRHD